MLQFIRGVDIPPAKSWDLVRWCLSQGADELSWREMAIVGHADPVIERANHILAPFRLPDQTRPTSVVYSGEPERQVVKLWRLANESIDLAAALLLDGIFTSPTYDKDGWIEDPTVYRAGEILLGVISHEDEAFLQISESEADELRKRGFFLYPKAIYG
jgi:hypothetical protein